MSAEEIILITGGAGYVGSHTILELLNAGYFVVAVDNFVNAVPDKSGNLPESLRRVQEITGKVITFYRVDLLDKSALESIFLKHDIHCVIHFAALKAVGESCIMPLDYYKNNVGGTITLLEVMRDHNINKFIFSSSATVYGIPEYLPIDEKHPVGGNITNPYGKTKYFIEEILQDLAKAEKDWSVTILRYFNPVGAHFSGKIGEDPQGKPNNLMPYVSQVAVGRQKELLVFGNDYETIDGTGVRDYIHVVDLALGHVAALQCLEADGKSCKVYNLGTGQGYSVLQMIDAFEKASGKQIPYKVVARREGDVPVCYSDASLAAKELNWKSKKGLKEMCEDIWRWQLANPHGFTS